MATITKTYKDDYEEGTTNATWTLTWTGTNATASGTSVSVAVPTLTVKCARTGLTRGEFYGQWGSLKVGSVYSSDYNLTWNINEQAWSNGATKTATKSPSAVSFTTSSIFTASNKTSKIVNVTLTGNPDNGYEIDLSGQDKNSSIWNGFNVGATNLGTICTITLNAPPTFTATESSSAPYFANVSTYKVNLANLSAKYGGTISSAVLTVGSQTASGTTNGELSIVLNATGTFTPSVKVTDSRGQVTTVNLSEITVSAHTNPTISAEALSVAPYYTTGTTYTAETSNATAYDDTTIASIALTIGNQTVSNTIDGQLRISPSTAGTFIPTITVIDSVGSSSIVNLPEITVNQYAQPSMNGLTIRRTESNGKPNEEATSAVIGYQIVWVEDLGHIKKPKLYVDGSTTEATATWYKSYNGTTSPYLSNAITNWNTVSSGDVVYAFMANAFPIPNSYTISSTVSDDYSTSTTLDITLPQAFFTIDFLAGGHGIAFGQLATAEGFYCNMDANFKDKANVMRPLFDFFYPVGSYYETSDTSFDPNVSWGGVWSLETEGQVHISAGANYAVSGALTDTTDGGEATHILTPSETATKNHSHTINHNHNFTQPTISSNTNGTHILGCPNTISRTTLKTGSSGTGYNVFYGTAAITRDGAKATGGAVQQHSGSSGGQTAANGTAHNNMQPYIIVNRWHRTA